jgi:inorganic pyrophosphatase
MKLTAGDKAPEIVNVIIEIPQGSLIKYELDKESGIVMVDRFAFTTMGYPANYGFIPETMAKDGDPTDVLVLSSHPINPGCGIKAVPIGMLEMEDEAGVDTKIIAVPPLKVDPIFGLWEKIDDVPQIVKDKIKHFFEHYKDLEKGKWVKIREWKDKATAIAEIKNSMK